MKPLLVDDDRMTLAQQAYQGLEKQCDKVNKNDEIQKEKVGARRNKINVLAFKSAEKCRKCREQEIHELRRVWKHKQKSSSGHLRKQDARAYRDSTSEHPWECASVSTIPKPLSSVVKHAGAVNWWSPRIIVYCETLALTSW